jgi:hypothetical protein
MKNLEPRKDYLNRHINPLPTNKICMIEFINKDSDGEHIYIGKWYPRLADNYTEENKPAEGYLGHATTMGPLGGFIGFNVWEQNNSEFIYYNILEK